MEKLELKHLAPYLPYGVKIGRHIRSNDLIIVLMNSYHISGFFNNEYIYFKPILRPLSDLTEEQLLELVSIKGYKDIAPTIDYKFKIVQKPFGKIWKITKLDDWALIISFNEPERLSYKLFSKLIEWHFDVFGLIEKGLAIDINTLND